jgi:hypothetical protein
MTACPNWRLSSTLHFKNKLSVQIPDGEWIMAGRLRYNSYQKQEFSSLHIIQTDSLAPNNNSSKGWGGFHLWSKVGGKETIPISS